MLRGDDGVVWSGRIPGGSRRWSESSDGGLVYADPAGRHDGIRRFTLGGGEAPGASLELRGGDLAGLGASKVASAVLRVADDCWRGELDCDPQLAGPGARCTRAIPIPPPWTPPPASGGGEGGPTLPCGYCS